MALESTETLLGKLKYVREEMEWVREELKGKVSENKYLKEHIAELEGEMEKVREEVKEVASENKYLKEHVAELEDDWMDSKVLMKKIKHLKKKCSNLKKERTYYINEGCVDDDLFEKYVGLYNKEENTLVIHHFVDNENIYPYRCYNFEGDYACGTVRGSWDSWNKDYILQKKCVRNSDGIYEGYVYYIIVENIIPGNEYEFKFKDVYGDWIEPVDEGDSDADCNVEVQANTNGTWNAVIRVR